MNRYLSFTLIFLIASPFFRILSIPAYVVVISLLVSNLIKVRTGHCNIINIKSLFVFIYIATASILSFYQNTQANLPYALIFLSIYVSFTLMRAKDILWLLNTGSKLLFIVLIMAWTGLLYGALGFGPIFSFINPNGDINDLYLTTLSNAGANYIRPGGIYDEPGYLGLYVSAIVFARRMMKLDDRFSAILLVMAFVTQSIVLVAFTLLWIGNIIFNINLKRINIIFKWLFPLILFFSILIVSSGLLEWTHDRLLLLLSDQIFNPRLVSLNLILDDISGSFIHTIFGFDVACIERSDMCSNLGGNPLVPLIFGGLLYSWPYYAAIIYLVYSSIFGLDALLKIGAIIVIASQPVMLELPYSALYIFVMVCWIESRNLNSKYSTKQLIDKNKATNYQQHKQVISRH